MGLVEWKFNYVPLTWISLELLIWIKIYSLVSSGTWTHTVLHYYFLRIACLPISTCLHNHILYFILQQTHYPKNPIRVTPIFLPFYFYPFNPYQSIHIHSNEYIFNILIHHSTTKNQLHPPPPTKNLLHTKTNPPYIFIFPLTNISFIEYPHIGDDMIIYIHISSERSPTDKQMIFLLSQIINIYIYQCYSNTKTFKTNTTCLPLL